MIRELNKTEEAILQLVRIGVGNEKFTNLHYDPEIWESIFKCSNRLAAQGFVFQALKQIKGINTFNVTSLLGLPAPLYLKWLMKCDQIERIHKKHETAISELSAFYAKNGIEMMLLKGYGLSLNYPHPTMRICGDIDIWLKGKQQLADNCLKEQKGIMPKKSSHHTIFTWMDCEIENHITILEYDTHKSNIKLDKILTPIIDQGEETIEVLGNKVKLPSPKFNAFFILRHNAIHYAIESINIRHLLDWAMFVKKYRNMLNWDEIYEFAKLSHTDVFLNCQNEICIKYLGFPTEWFPIRHAYEDLTKRIIADIFEPEFNENAPNMYKHFIGYCKVKTKRLWANRWKSQITNSDSFASAFISYGINRIKETIFHIK